MKNKSFFSRWQNQVLALATAALLFSCSNLEPFSLEEQESSLRSTSNGGPSVPPTFFNTGPGGNVECSETGDYEFSSGRINYNGTFAGTFPEGFNIEVRDGKYISWSYEDPNKEMCLDGISIIVKGGPAANVYTYESGVSGDNNLVAPTNRGGQTPDLSNLTICFDLKPCEPKDEKCFDWKGETAWAAKKVGHTRYNLRGGNWATFIDLNNDLTDNSIKLFAGQHIFAGTASFTPISIEGMEFYQINLNLNTGVRLASSSENVKIQTYKEAPSGNPAPGRFDHKFDARTETILIPTNDANFIGFHLDLELKGKEIECPTEEE